MDKIKKALKDSNDFLIDLEWSNKDMMLNLSCPVCGYNPNEKHGGGEGCALGDLIAENNKVLEPSKDTDCNYDLDSVNVETFPVDFDERGEAAVDDFVIEPGDHDMNYAYESVSLTDSGEEKYKEFITILRKWSRGSDSWGDDLKSKMSRWFNPKERGIVWRHPRTTEEDKATLLRFYELDNEIRYNLLRSCS